jgi:DNA-binding transcriptional ArsR family regulator
MLAKNPQNLTSIADQFSMTRQAVSLHVKVLTECGVVQIHQEGRERYCHLEAKKLAEVHDWLGLFRQLWEPRFDQLDHLLQRMAEDDSHIPD